MDIAAILKKAAEGTELSADEREALKGYDPNAAAAAARKKAEEKAAAAEESARALKAQVDDLQAQVDEAANAGKSELEKAQAAAAKAAKERDAQAARVAELEAKAAASARQAKIDGVIDKSGIRFVPGVDNQLFRDALRKTLGTVEETDLENEAVTKPLLEAFRTANKAAIADGSGSGGTGGAHVGGGPTPAGTTVVDGASLIAAATSGDIEAAQKEIDAAVAANAAGKLEIK